MAEQGAENHRPSSDNIPSAAGVPMACPNCGQTSISYFRLLRALRFWRLECENCHASLRLARLFNGYGILAAVYGLALLPVAAVVDETGVLGKAGTGAIQAGSTVAPAVPKPDGRFRVCLLVADGAAWGGGSFLTATHSRASNSLAG